jgi:hypothetical protein
MFDDGIILQFSTLCCNCEWKVFCLLREFCPVCDTRPPEWVMLSPFNMEDIFMFCIADRKQLWQHSFGSHTIHYWIRREWPTECTEFSAFSLSFSAYLILIQLQLLTHTVWSQLRTHCYVSQFKYQTIIGWNRSHFTPTHPPPPPNTHTHTHLRVHAPTHARTHACMHTPKKKKDRNKQIFV